MSDFSYNMFLAVRSFSFLSAWIPLGRLYLIFLYLYFSAANEFSKEYLSMETEPNSPSIDSVLEILFSSNDLDKLEIGSLSHVSGSWDNSPKTPLWSKQMVCRRVLSSWLYQLWII